MGTAHPTPSTHPGSGANIHPSSLSASLSVLSGGNSKENANEGINKQERNNNLLLLLKEEALPHTREANTRSVLKNNLTIF
jgi:hypothetical protein